MASSSISNSTGNSTNGETVLYQIGMQQGAQFLYDKHNASGQLVASSGYTIPQQMLVSVHLINKDTNMDYQLQSGFSTANQECSCYYLNAHDLQQKVKSLPDSLQYQISFVDDSYTNITK